MKVKTNKQNWYEVVKEKGYTLMGEVRDGIYEYYSVELEDEGETNLLCSGDCHQILLPEENFEKAYTSDDNKWLYVNNIYGKEVAVLLN